MLSLEWSYTTKSEELNVSIGTYMQPEEIEKAFGLKNIPRPWGCGPISPKPDVGAGVFLLWGFFLIVLFMIHSRYATISVATGSDIWLMLYGMFGVSLPPLGTLIYLFNFEVQRWRDSDYSPYASSE